MKRNSRQRNNSKRRRQRLSIQPLEKRQLMAADIGMIDGFVAINGTELNDVAEVYSESDTVIVRVATYGADGEEISSDSKTYNQSDVAGIIFQAGDGDDLFVNDTNIDSITRSGGGHDTVMGGGGNDILAVGTGNDVVFGGGGDDLILAGPGSNLIVPAAQTEAAAQTEPVPEPNAEPPADQTPVADDTVDQTPAELELVDQPTDVNSETPQEDATSDHASPTEVELTEDTMAENDSDPMVDDPELVDDGDVAVEDSSNTEVTADNFVCEAHDASDSDTADDTVVESDVETSVLPEQNADPVAVAEQVPADETVVPGNTDPVETVDAGDEPIDESAVDLADEDDTDDSDVVDTAADVPENLAGVNESDNDVIFGGSGDDWIFGESGSDLIFGGSSPIDDALLRMMIADRLSLS